MNILLQHTGFELPAQSLSLISGTDGSAGGENFASLLALFTGNSEGKHICQTGMSDLPINLTVLPGESSGEPIAAGLVPLIKGLTDAAGVIETNGAGFKDAETGLEIPAFLIIEGEDGEPVSIPVKIAVAEDRKDGAENCESPHGSGLVLIISADPDNLRSILTGKQPPDIPFNADIDTIGIIPAESEVPPLPEITQQMSDEPDEPRLNPGMKETSPDQLPAQPAASASSAGQVVTDNSKTNFGNQTAFEEPVSAKSSLHLPEAVESGLHVISEGSRTDIPLMKDISGIKIPDTGTAQLNKTGIISGSAKNREEDTAVDEPAVNMKSAGHTVENEPSLYVSERTGSVEVSSGGDLKHPKIVFRLPYSDTSLRIVPSGETPSDNPVIRLLNALVSSGDSVEAVFTIAPESSDQTASVPGISEKAGDVLSTSRIIVEGAPETAVQSTTEPIKTSVEDALRADRKPFVFENNASTQNTGGNQVQDETSNMLNSEITAGKIHVPVSIETENQFVRQFNMTEIQITPDLAQAITDGGNSGNPLNKNAVIPHEINLNETVVTGTVQNKAVTTNYGSPEIKIEAPEAPLTTDISFGNEQQTSERFTGIQIIPETKSKIHVSGITSESEGKNNPESSGAVNSETGIPESGTPHNDSSKAASRTGKELQSPELNTANTTGDNNNIRTDESGGTADKHGSLDKVSPAPEVLAENRSGSISGRAAHDIGIKFTSENKAVQAEKIQTPVHEVSSRSGTAGNTSEYSVIRPDETTITVNAAHNRANHSIVFESDKVRPFTVESTPAVEIPEIEYRTVQTVEAGKETTGHKYEKSGVVIEQKSNQMFTNRGGQAPEQAPLNRMEFQEAPVRYTTEYQTIRPLDSVPAESKPVNIADGNLSYIVNRPETNDMTNIHSPANSEKASEYSLSPERTGVPLVPNGGKDGTMQDVRTFENKGGGTELPAGQVVNNGRSVDNGLHMQQQNEYKTFHSPENKGETGSAGEPNSSNADFTVPEPPQKSAGEDNVVKESVKNSFEAARRPEQNSKYAHSVKSADNLHNEFDISEQSAVPPKTYGYNGTNEGQHETVFTGVYNDYVTRNAGINNSPEALNPDTPVSTEEILAGMQQTFGKTNASIFDAGTGVSHTGNFTGAEERVLDSIVSHARIMMLKGRSSAVIKLEPPSLGRLRLEIVTERSKVTGKIIVESHEVKEIIENRLFELRESLGRNGLKVEAFDVQVGHNSGTDGWANREDFERMFKSTNVSSGNSSAASDREIPENDVPLIRNRTLHEGIFDVWI